MCYMVLGNQRAHLCFFNLSYSLNRMPYGMAELSTLDFPTCLCVFLILLSRLSSGSFAWTYFSKGRRLLT